MRWFFGGRCWVSDQSQPRLSTNQCPHMQGQLDRELQRLLASTCTRTVGLAAARTPNSTSVRIVVASPSASAGDRLVCCTSPNVAEAENQISRVLLYNSDEDSEECIWHNGAALSRQSRVQLHLMHPKTSAETLRNQATHFAEAAVARAADSHAAADCERFADGTEVEAGGHGRYIVRWARIHLV